MGKGRLEAFSDGVLAIIITIMVLELKVPHGADLDAIRPILPEFTAYVVSFVYIAIYWNNHHHLMHVVKKVDGWIMWANMHLLFWLSLVPILTGWIGENPSAPVPAAGYGIVLFMAGISWLLLQRAIIHRHGPSSELARAVGSDWKGKISGVAYLSAIGLAFISSWIAIGIYIAMALVWIVPDRRISRAVEAHLEEHGS
jgi:uncharacterized membrane protein